MKKNLVLIAIFGIFSSFSLKAETTNSWYNKFYVGTGVGAIGNIKKEDTKDKISNIDNNVYMLFGYEINQYFNLEFNYSYFFTKKYSDTWSNEFKDSATNLGVLLKPKYQINNKNTVFAVIGIGYMQMKNKAPLYNTKYSAINYKFGAGYEFNLLKNHIIGLNFNYTIMPDITLKDKNTTKNWVDTSFPEGLFYYKYSFNS